MGVEGVDIGEQRGHDGWHARTQVLRGEAVEVPGRHRRIRFHTDARNMFDLVILRYKRCIEILWRITGMALSQCNPGMVIDKRVVNEYITPINITPESTI